MTFIWIHFISMKDWSHLCSNLPLKTIRLHRPEVHEIKFCYFKLYKDTHTHTSTSVNVHVCFRIKLNRIIWLRRRSVLPVLVISQPTNHVFPWITLRWSPIKFVAACYLANRSRAHHTHFPSGPLQFFCSPSRPSTTTLTSCFLSRPSNHKEP